jgi:hypothetical protein
VAGEQVATALIMIAPDLKALAGATATDELP